MACVVFLVPTTKWSLPLARVPKVSAISLMLLPPSCSLTAACIPEGNRVIAFERILFRSLSAYMSSGFAVESTNRRPASCRDVMSSSETVRDTRCFRISSASLIAMRASHVEKGDDPPLNVCRFVKALLHDILGVFLAASNAPGQSKDSWFVTLHERIECATSC